MNRCKNLCLRVNTPNITIPYITGEICYCSICAKRFYREDNKGYRCMCCKSLLRMGARSKSRANVEVKRI